MNISLLLYLGAALFAAGIIMVLLRAFQDRFLWGLGILLLFPLVYPFYSLLNISDLQIRNGFLLSVVAALLCAVALYGGAAKDVPIEEAREIAEKIPTAVPPEDPLPNEDAAAQVTLHDEEHYDPIDRGNELEVVEIKPLPPTGDRHVRVDERAITRTWYTVTPDQVLGYIDEPARLLLTGGSQKQGHIAEVTDQSVSLAQTVSGGEVVLEYAYHNIERIEVLSSRRPGPPNEPGEVALPEDSISKDAGVTVSAPPDDEHVRPQSDSSDSEKPVGIELPKDVIEMPIPGTEETIFPPEAIQDEADTENRIQDTLDAVETSAVQEPLDSSQNKIDTTPVVEPEPVGERQAPSE